MDADRELIQHTLLDLELAIKQLQQEKEAIEVRIQQMNERRLQWENVLRKSQANAVSSKSGSIRRPRGENLQIITHFFESHGDVSHQLGEIVKETGLPWGSCRAVLENNKDRFYKDAEGLWRMNEAEIFF